MSDRVALPIEIDAREIIKNGQKSDTM